MPKQEPIRPLTILLLKPEFSESSALDEDIGKVHKLPVTLGKAPLGTLIAKQTPAKPPDWLKLFAGSIDSTPTLKSASVSAAFLIRVGGRLFALVFGQGRHLLRPGACEERFGLRVTLNSVDPTHLRAVDVATLESNPFHAKRQASRAAPLGEFGLDLDQDILRAVTGKPTDPERGTQMTGIDSLSVRVRVDLASLRPLLRTYLEISEQKDYQKLFPWVDHVSEVRDPIVKETLFQELIHVLNSKNPDKVWAAIPEIIEWTTFDSFRIGSFAWYRISTDFVNQIDADVSKLVASGSIMPNWGDEREDAYNKRIALKSKGKLALMDCVMIKHPGMPSPIEFCDLYSDNRRLIHVKRYGQSSILSHLFMQGLVSADCLLSDSQFRLELNKKLPASHSIYQPHTRPSPDQYEVAFAIGSTETGPLRLPFFSRVTLKNAARTLLESFGYRVTLNKIRINKLEDISV